MLISWENLESYRNKVLVNDGNNDGKMMGKTGIIAPSVTF